MDKLQALSTRQLPLRFLVTAVVSFFIIAGLIGGIILTKQKQNIAPKADTRDACLAQSAIVWDGTTCPPNTSEISRVILDAGAALPGGSGDGQTAPKTALCCKPDPSAVPTTVTKPTEPAPNIPTTEISPTVGPNTQCKALKPELSFFCREGCVPLIK
jgi:hypothetical protein